MDPFQSGFRSQYSTLSALLKVTDDFYKAIDESKVTLLLLLDYSKAFDTINHRLLLSKLRALGCGDTVLEWFQSYLSDRLQKVVTDRDESTWSNVVNGVPQGSILGPLLFIVMVSDLRYCIHCCNYHMYADDTQLYFHSCVEQINEAVSVINDELEHLHNYSLHNGLMLNPLKSQFLIIGSVRNIRKLNQYSIADIHINNVPIKRVTHAKNLGITYDEVLSWRKHIELLVCKAYYKLKLLYRYKKFLSFDSKKYLCNSLILSHFNYCNVLFCNLSQNLKYQIQKVQNSCIRFIYNLKKKDRHSMSEYLVGLQWLNMDNRRCLQAYSQMYKIVHNLCPDYLCSSLRRRSDVHTYFTRSQQHFNVSYRRTAQSSKSFFYTAPLMYNALPDDIKAATSLKSFQNKCRCLLFTAQCI